MSLQPSAKIGRYHVLGKLAAGGMAEILLARLPGPRGFEKPVVIKRVLHHLAASEELSRMFLEEAQLVADLRHPCIAQVFELGSEGGELFLVMEYLAGESVGGIMRRLWAERRAMPIAAATAIAAAVCAGLHAAHELRDANDRPLRVVHRDVSPSNLFVTYDGHVKLLDFGVAKVESRGARTDAGRIKGKGPYMSPEQALGMPLDRRSDLFSLGTVLFEMCTLTRLFQRENPLLVCRALCEDAIPSAAELRPDLPAALVATIERALQRDPSRRFASALEMRKALGQVSRELTPEEPEEVLASLMQTLFRDRIEQKRAFLLGLDGNVTPSAVPEAESDLATQIPSILSRPGLSVRRGDTTRQAGRFVVGAAVALALGAGALGVLRRQTRTVSMGAAVARMPAAQAVAAIRLVPDAAARAPESVSADVPPSPPVSPATTRRSAQESVRRPNGSSGPPTLAHSPRAHAIPAPSAGAPSAAAPATAAPATAPVVPAVPVLAEEFHRFDADRPTRF